MKAICLVAIALALGGCATKKTGLYDWGGYDAALYNGYKDPTTAGANLRALETHVLALERTNQKVAPGMYADLGMLELQSGNKEKAQAYFKKERDTWPESAGLMNALINNGATPKAKESTS